MFNKNEFNAMLAKRGMTKEELASLLGIRRETLYRRIKGGGNFTYNEIAKMIKLFSKDEVFDALFA